MRIVNVAVERNAVAEITRRKWETDRGIEVKVREILDAVMKDGDEALTTFTRQFDCRLIDAIGLRLSRREIERAYDLVGPELLKAIRVAKRNISRFHRRQRLRSWTLASGGARLQQRVSALHRVGIYVPGGKAAYPSTVLMNALPARIAGVAEIAMATPCSADGKINPAVLVAAAECGITEIYRIGGAQAIAALAYGTESIGRVDKITGPGNAYVAAAKRLVFGHVGIDMIAGPTEVVVIADEAALPEYVAADLLAQAEHDELASPICVTTSATLAERVCEQVRMQLEGAPRRAIAQRAMDGQGTILISKNLRQAAALVNEMAPEHVEILTRNAARVASWITQAGSIFVGPYAIEALGDYVAGPNHTLPTMGSARFASPLGVYDFLRFSNVIQVSRNRFLQLAPHAEILAEAEGLFGHAASLRIRRERR